MRHLAPALLLGLALAGAVGAAGARAEPAGEAWELCAAQIALAERARGLPSHLLSAIARVEAGRWRAETGENLAWPWTVTAEGEGRFLPSKAAAIAAVERLQAAGVRNIDVGCMQVNLRHHPEAFDNLESAFDPAQNVGYAVDYLRGLRQRWGSWTQAVGNYHSATPGLSGAYRLKVFRALNAERQRAARARRAARLAAVAAAQP